MTQVARYGHMLEVNVTRMTMHVKASFRVTGSVLDDTIEGDMMGAETRLDLDSTDPPERVAKVIRNAERGCFVMQALLRPVPVTAHTLLNGEPLPPDAEI
jgi:organic hydroperoxide reductase OsmC/OhrA